MSTLETNSIGKYSGNNVSIDDALNLKSYTTAERDALTSVAGDVIYNSTTSKVQVYDGTSWSNLGGALFSVEYLLVGGGGSGGPGTNAVNYGAGAASGVVRTGDTNYTTSLDATVTVGAGSTAVAPATGNSSVFYEYTATGGNSTNTGSTGADNDDFSGAGGGAGTTAGGGAGAAANASGSNGGSGATTTIISTTQATSASVGEVVSSSVYFGGGGGGGPSGAGGNGGGGDATGTLPGNPGTANTGGGGCGGVSSQTGGINGGSGVVILKYPDTYTISVGAGLTSSSATVTGYKIEIFTAGTGTVSWS